MRAMQGRPCRWRFDSGAGVSADYGERGDDAQDFTGQGVGNLTSGLFQAMPVGGSQTAKALIVSAKAARDKHAVDALQDRSLHAPGVGHTPD